MLAVGANIAHAAGTTDAAAQYDSFLSLFSNTAAKWQPILTEYAKRIFWILAAIDLVLVFFPLVMKGADLGETLGELIRFILTIGFFYAMVEYGPEWANSVVSSLRQAGAAAGGFPEQLYPGQVLITGLSIAAKMTADSSIFSPGTAIVLGFSWVVLVLAFAWMAAIVAVALVESYVIIYGAVIFLGLGGSRYTRDYAISVMRYALAVGAKLFTITLVVDLMQGAFSAWGQYWDNTLTSAAALMGLAVVAALITKMVPDLVQSMITGQSGVGNHVGGMASTVLAAGAAAASGGLLGSAAAGMLGSGGGTSAGGPISGGPALTQAMQADLSARPGLTPGLAGGGVGGSSGWSGEGAMTSSSARPAQAVGSRNTAHGIAKTIGTMAELVVPGMEGASAIGIAPRPTPLPQLDSAEGDFASAPEMVVTPAPAPSGGEPSPKTAI
ncbi:MAG: P-type conjugative transfer protein TrbL [Paracoccaceae bacterium]|nr:P-type conjugative transfer protein TrbL [Paracoccaceae bacterium]